MHMRQLLLIGAAGLMLTAGTTLAQDRDDDPGDRPEARERDQDRERPDPRQRDGERERDRRDRRERRPDLPREMMQQIMEEADANDDGELDRNERETARDMIRMKAEEREIELLAKYDADGDGELSRAERQAAREDERKAAAERRAQRYAELFDEIDADDDGSISRDEWLAAREEATEQIGENHEQAKDHARERTMERRRAEMIKPFDKDGDGELNEDERRAMREQWRDRMRDRRDRERGPQREGRPMPEEEDGELDL